MIEQAKTAAGVREVDLSLDLVSELNTWRADRKPASVDEFVFATDSGQRHRRGPRLNRCGC